MDESRDNIGAVTYDDGRLLFGLTNVGGVTCVDIKCSNRKHGFQYKQMPAIEVICKLAQQMNQKERLEAYNQLFSIVQNSK